MNSQGFDSQGQPVKMDSSNNLELDTARINMRYHSQAMDATVALKEKEEAVESLARALATEQQVHASLQSRWEEKVNNYESFIHNNLLLALSQFHNHSFSTLLWKVGMAFSSTVDFIYSATLNATVRLVAYGLDNQT